MPPTNSISRPSPFTGVVARNPVPPELLGQTVGRLAQRLRETDEEVRVTMRKVERWLSDNNPRRILKAPIDSATMLAWSCRNNIWRLVIVEEEQNEYRAETLFGSEIDVICEAFTSGALESIVKQAMAVMPRAVSPSR